MSKLKQLLFSLNDTDRKTIEEKLKEKDQQIDRLKQQLEELMLLLSKYEIEEHKPVYCTLAGTECEYLGNVDELKQQLAEKDKEIELLKHLGNHETATEMFKENAKLIIEKRQLAIQELEKVKKTLTAYVRADHIIWDFNVNEVIDQQIKELKGE